MNPNLLIWDHYKLCPKPSPQFLLPKCNHKCSEASAHLFRPTTNKQPDQRKLTIIQFPDPLFLEEVYAPRKLVEGDEAVVVEVYLYHDVVYFFVSEVGVAVERHRVLQLELTDPFVTCEGLGLVVEQLVKGGDWGLVVERHSCVAKIESIF